MQTCYEWQYQQVICLSPYKGTQSDSKIKLVIIYPTAMQHPRYYQTIMNGMANKYSVPQYHLFVIKYVRDGEKEREMGYRSLRTQKWCTFIRS